MSLLSLYGLFAVSLMLAFYALEQRGPWYTFGFACSCLLGSSYGFLQGAWPFGLVEGVWGVVAFRKWLQRRAALLVLALGLLALPGLCAAEATLRILGDPSFLPQAGQCMGTSSYAYGATSEYLENYLQLVTQTRTYALNQLLQALEYGVTDDLSLKLSDTLAWQSELSQPAFGAETTTLNQGPEDPSVTVTWRALDQASWPLSWDLSAAEAPDLVPDRVGSPAQTGTNGRGGQVASLGTALSWVTRSYTLFADFDEIYQGPRAVVNSNDTVTDDTATLQGQLGLNIQFRFTRRLSVNAGVTGYWSGGFRGVNQTTAKATFTGGGDETVINAAANWQVLEDRLVASLTYGNDATSARQTVVPGAALPNGSTGVSNEAENIAGLRLEYVFL